MDIIEAKKHQKLNELQVKAVETEHKNTIIVAAAGSGKTKTLTERIRYLIQVKNIKPENIVAITFTNKAADEMKDRLIDLECVNDIIIGTIHSFANRILKSSGTEYKIYNDEEENEIYHHVITKTCKYLTFKRWLEFKEIRQKSESGLIDESIANSFLSATENYELIEIQSLNPLDPIQYHITIPEMIEMNQLLTFDQLLIKSKEYFSSINGTLEHLLLDEFQDIGHLEFKFIIGLNAENKFFIGDDWQAIYGFKGASVNYMINLSENNQDWNTIKLEVNYRNPQSIIDLGYEVIKQTKMFIKKNVISFNNGKNVNIMHAKDAEIEEIVARYKEEGKKIAILTRSNRQIVKLKSRLANIIEHDAEFDVVSYLQSIGDDLDTGVEIMTVHSAKGLEFDNVVIYGDFPIHLPAYLVNDEERRVLYVAITRTKNDLIFIPESKVKKQ